MTREERINLCLKDHNIPITSLEAKSIIKGIEWADEHPCAVVDIEEFKKAMEE